MNNLIHNNKIFIPYEYKTEKEFEQEIVSNSKAQKSIHVSLNVIIVPYSIDYFFPLSFQCFVVSIASMMLLLLSFMNL